MPNPPGLPPPPPRVPTGIAGLDAILNGGLFKGGIYVVAGAPGSGKTILANQMVFHHVKAGGRALYATLLAETHGRMMGQLQVLSYFDPTVVGEAVKYVNGFTAIEDDGLAGLLKLLRSVVREQRADLLVLDGMVTASALARSGVDYKKFISELQTWVGVLGCTVVFLTSATGDISQPEHTMVDGIFELRVQRPGPRAFRLLTVLKFRGSGFVEGAHAYVITSDGITVFPRLEATAPTPPGEMAGVEERAPFGIAKLDKMLEGGLPRASTTLVLGASGTGKTTLGLHFLMGGVARGERCLHFGFFENPRDLRLKASRLGFKFDDATERGDLHVHWEIPAERLLDASSARLLELVEKHRIQRVFIDGLVGFKEALFPERISAFFTALSNRLSIMGVTTLITEEMRELFVQHVEVPTEGVSAIFQNILFVRHVDVDGRLSRLMQIMKTRDSAHDSAMYEFEITRKGIEFGGQLFGTPLAQGLTSGTAIRRGKPARRSPSTGKRRR